MLCSLFNAVVYTNIYQSHIVSEVDLLNEKINKIASVDSAQIEIALVI